VTVIVWFLLEVEESEEIWSKHYNLNIGFNCLFSSNVMLGEVSSGYGVLN